MLLPITVPNCFIPIYIRVDIAVLLGYRGNMPRWLVPRVARSSSVFLYAGLSWSWIVAVSDLGHDGTISDMLVPGLHTYVLIP